MLRTALVPASTVLIALTIAWVLTGNGRHDAPTEINDSVIGVLLILPVIQVADSYDRARTLWSQHQEIRRRESYREPGDPLLETAFTFLEGVVASFAGLFVIGAVWLVVTMCRYLTRSF